MSDEEVKKAEETPVEPKAEETSKKITRNLDAIVEELGQLTVMEAADLAKKLAKAWDIDLDNMAAGVAPAGGGAPVVDADAPVSVILKDFKEGAKINVLKTVKAIKGLGLMESKQFVEALPKEIDSEIPRDKAEKIKKQLEEAGGTVEIK
jgi:large subunit ribosomal protein L7/L12